MNSSPDENLFYGQALLKALRREKGREDISFFAQYYLSHLLENETPEFHLEIYRLLMCSQRLGIAAPRGFAKSTIVQIIYGLHCLLYNYGEDILSISASASLAEEWLRKIKFELENNKYIREDFGSIISWGEGISPKWTGEHIILKKDGVVFSQWRARGRGCQVRGFRPSKVFCDDLEDEQLVRSEEQRKDLRNWFLSSLINVLSVKQQFVFIGTLLHPLALLTEVTNQQGEFKDWTVRKYRALSDDGKSLWETRYSADWLKKRKEEIGTYAFQQEFQNNPIASDIVLFRPDWLHFHERLPKIGDVFMGIDPAISKRDTADYTGIVFWGKGEDGKIYELESVKGRWGTWDLAERIVTLYLKYKPLVIGLEIIAFQQVLKDVLVSYAKEKGIRLPIQAITLGRFKEGEKKASRDKVSRAMTVIHFFEQDSIRLIKNGVLYEQLATFPTGAHDDLVDAAVYGLYLIQKFSQKMTVFRDFQTKPTQQEQSPQMGADNRIPCLDSLEEVFEGDKDWRI